MDLDLPFKIGYSGPDVEGICKTCSLNFIPDELRIAEMVQSQLHDGKDPVWFHSRCFFTAHQVKLTNHIENFENIKYDDQLEIIMKIDPNSAEKFKKIAEKRQTEASESYKNFGVEYANTNTDSCATCREPIDRNELRIKKIVFDTDAAAKFGKEILWAHLHCFTFNRDQYDYLWDGKLLTGFNELQPAHQVIIEEALPAIIEIEVETKAKKPRRSEIPRLKEENLEMKIASQTAELVRVRQSLQKVCTKEDLQYLLIINECDVIERMDDLETLLDRCADILTFGSLYKCQKCQKGDMTFSKYGYTCNAWIDEWVKCGHTEEAPLRMKCSIPDDLKQNAFFATCEPKAEDRAVRPNTAGDSPMPSSSSGTSMVVKKARKVKVEKLQLKDGTAVDPKSKLNKLAHVFRRDKVLYNSVLGLTDIQKNKNSFYKLQVLESDTKANQHQYARASLNSYWLFTSWGRTGTDIGSTKTESFGTADLAIAAFEKQYEEQTGNEWKSRQNFKKLPGKFYPIDINYSNEVETNTDIASRLPTQVEELMKLLFNVNNMQMTMREFKLDLQKMPLGKLSVKQLQSAFLALSELEDAVNNGSSRNELVGLSNKFFTLIPHSFGLDKAPVLDTMKKIDEKREMVDSLFDIENTFAIMTQASTTPMNSFDAYYKELNAQVEFIGSDSDEFKLIQTYIQNTSMHGFRLTILGIFKVQRHGEKERYAKFKSFPNRQLLWHGSRVTNFASIIKNGLKISQQVNGSMFGRGIYFADMVSKSANYCQVMPPQNAGLLALCEVALGNVQSLKTAQHITNLPPNFNSVQGIGITQPDVTKAHRRDDGVMIPLGVPVNQPNQNQGVPVRNQFGFNIPGRFNQVFGARQLGMPSLMYNEFIVYNEEQVNMQYLVKFKMG